MHWTGDSGLRKRKDEKQRTLLVVFLLTCNHYLCILLEALRIRTNSPAGKLRCLYNCTRTKIANIEKMELVVHDLFLLLMYCCYLVQKYVNYLFRDFLYGGVRNLKICSWSPQGPCLRLSKVGFDCLHRILGHWGITWPILFSTFLRLLKFPTQLGIVVRKEAVSLYAVWKFLLAGIMGFFERTSLQMEPFFEREGQKYPFIILTYDEEML